MNRRSLFGALALSPLMAVEAFTKEKPTGEPIPEATQIVIHGSKKKNIEPPSQVLLSDGNGGVFTISGISMPKNDPTKQVSIAVGDDGNLWLKRKDGQWKRIVTE